VSNRVTVLRASEPPAVNGSNDDAASERRTRERTQPHEETQIELVDRLSLVAEFGDDDITEHTKRVGELAGRLAASLGLPEPEGNLVRHAASLHDVGMVGVPLQIRRKPGALTPAELQAVRAHTTLGARILSGGRSPLLRMAERIARSHHERWDGGGYPDGLAGEKIPAEARIVSVADAVDALSHARPYREAWPLEQVLALISAGRGVHFDPAVVDALQSDSCVSYLHRRSVAQSQGRVPPARGPRP
jgi:putative two-component system response regulator